MDPLQLLFSPVFGFLANKFRSIRAITLAACITYVGGNIIYSTLSLFPYDARYYMLLVCRFMVGISTGKLRGVQRWAKEWSCFAMQQPCQSGPGRNSQPMVQFLAHLCKCIQDLSKQIFLPLTAIAAPFRSYVAGATYQSERTSQLSILASAQSLGFILGPGIQAALTPLQCSDAVDEEGGPYFTIDMYTVPG